ncbi:DUF1932 domain-containing protein [Brevibacterium sp.]|uniref:DUF1932 domain-containing protein n=1 Tax=Brevibacterium sp. TaxID=1701 RepID=UPI002811923A|nr:DUF1932 domain-containing protein [Brevibacterium sp.]
MTTVGILGAGMVGSAWLRGIPWDTLDMTPTVFEPADIDVSPFSQASEASELGACDIVLVFVSGGTAETAIRSTFGPDGTAGPAEILDFSSNGPEGKRSIAEWCTAHGSSYVDVTILGAIAAGGLSTPLAIAGTPSGAAQQLISASGASLLRAENSEAGAAARLKLVRSIVTKGLEALACEAQTIAAEYNLGDDYRRIFGDFETGSFTTIMDSMVRTHPDHRERRGREVREVIAMVNASGRSSALLDAVAQNYEQGAFRPVCSH